MEMFCIDGKPIPNWFREVQKNYMIFSSPRHDRVCVCLYKNIEFCFAIFAVVVAAAFRFFFISIEYNVHKICCEMWHSIRAECRDRVYT